MKKFKNAEILEIVKDVFENIEGVEDDVREAVLTYVTTQKASMEKKAEREKIRNAEKPKKEDDFLPVVKSVITYEFQDMPQILEALAAQGVETSRQKVSSRLKKLVDANEVVKDIQKTSNHMCTRYKLA